MRRNRAKRMEKRIAEIVKNSREKLVVELSEFSPEAGKVFNMVVARLHYDDGSGQYRPGKNGINIQVKFLPKLVAALQQAEAEARSAGLLPDAEEVATLCTVRFSCRPFDVLRRCDFAPAPSLS